MRPRAATLRTKLGARVPDQHRTQLKMLFRWPRPIWGTPRRLRPYSLHFGEDRGTPVDRLPIEMFLVSEQSRIRGRVAEVKSADYTMRFGHGVEEVTVIDIDADNPQVTLVADLCVAGSLPAERFDCLVLTQVLHIVADWEAALRNAWQALAPGGSALVTVPAIAPVVAEINDRWRYTPDGLRDHLPRLLPEAEVHTEGFGNLITAVGFLLGLAAEELPPKAFTTHDPRYPLVVGFRVTKRGAA